jgi:DNA adenine methylase
MRGILMSAIVCGNTLSWTGGKFYSAPQIVEALPPASAYGTYVEPFGGAAHVLLRKPRGTHLEVFNDLNSDLINFWMTARDHPQAVQARVDSLPYSRRLYEDYQASLEQCDPMDKIERAARWFYVHRSTFGTAPDHRKGWGYSVTNGHNRAHSLRSATALLSLVAERMRYVQIECQDFASLIKVYERSRTLFYVDPPYVGCEDYYAVNGLPLFTEEQHRELSALLNATPALVALSYYEHPLVDELYPSSRWRRITWTQPKAVEKTRKQRQLGSEMLLMNYSETQQSLWAEG